MTNEVIDDVRPNTLPAGAIRVAHNGGEWLVLSDWALQAPSHTCDAPFMSRGYSVFITTGWGRCAGTSCSALVIDGFVRRDETFATLAEANAAFDRMEQEFRHVCPPVYAVNTSPHSTCEKCR